MAKKFELGKSYLYSDIEKLAESWGGIDIEDYGPNYVGRNILVVVSDKEDVATFVLDGNCLDGFTYKLVFFQ